MIFRLIHDLFPHQKVWGTICQ